MKKEKLFILKLRRQLEFFMQRSRSYSSLAKSNIVTNEITNNKSKLNPWFITGLIDAEGSFTVSVLKNCSARGFCTQSLNSNKLSLVVWSTNLESTVGVRFTPGQLAMVKLSLDLKSIIIGLLLSDGWLCFAFKSAPFLILIPIPYPPPPLPSLHDSFFN